MQIQPYLFFDGRCEEAINFYVQQLGGQIEMLMRYQDMPEEARQEGTQHIDPQAIMHVSVIIGDSRLMASDGCPTDGDNTTAHQGYALSLNPASIEEGRDLFDKLAQDGDITMPYEPTFWAKGFGMLTDKFGVNWMINVE
ncbi:VOC family protein [Serratia sp. NPDC078593]|uniref:VOC family protein n=1 Tax=unclassified Serratia (in: enterobacteria) TaxID=2647522 RepID=UPI0037D75FFF